MIYTCKCEKCNKNTKIEVNKGDKVNVTAYGYLLIRCYCGGFAFSKWHGYDGKMIPMNNF